MYAIEFEADVVDGRIQLPEEYRSLESTHLKAIILLPEKPGASETAPRKYDFRDLAGQLTWQGDAVEEQRKLRDEWQ